MTFLVPFDGSALSKAALTRARVYAVALEAAPATVRREVLREHPIGVLAMSVIPESARYAREKGWIADDEPFQARAVVERLHGEVLEIDPGADFAHERVDGAAAAGTISNRLRRRAEAEDVSVVFIGSENAGRIITPITSVGGGVTADEDYDVHIVRRRLPPEARERLRSEFHFVD
ncbi:MAG: universal stress protein [Halobacteriales archaeon]|nr:universal stress protein [Halobacteriales archaeon]